MITGASQLLRLWAGVGKRWLSSEFIRRRAGMVWRPSWRNNHCPFIVVDAGETAQNYVISSWPTDFLIDESGKAHWGFSGNPRSDLPIEELLR